MEIKIVLGYTFGDEGKGATVQWLCKQAIKEGKKPLVVRFSGGPQAGHNIYDGEIHHTCSTYGAGVLCGAETIMAGNFNTYFDPISANIERKKLLELGLKKEQIKLQVGIKTMVITPYDVFDNMQNKKNLQDGSCGKGIYSTYKRTMAKHWLPMSYYKSTATGFGTEKPETLLKLAREYYHAEPVKEYEDMFIESLNEMYKNAKFTAEIPTEGNIVLIFEGSQGLLLDADAGLYPNVTPSLVGLNALHQNYLQNAEVYLVTRSYTTRHGNGFDPCMPLPLPEMFYKDDNNVKNEFQGEFKVGGLELGLLRMAEHRHCLDNNQKRFNIKFNLVVTHLDKVVDSFVYADERDCFQRIGKPSPKQVCEAIAKESILDFDNMYYSVNNQSDFDKIKQ